MSICKRERFLLLFILFSIGLLAQNQRVSGRLVTNGEDGKTTGLPYASVVILNSRDSSYITGVASDENGYFQISNPAKATNRYILKASYMGYVSMFYPLSGHKEKHIKMGTIRLEESDIKLGEVTVTAQIPEVEQVGDTTIINTSVYKTPEGSYLEDLVRRIPGLEYDRQKKTLIYNGLTINEINVNGETYFANNIELALENLPVEMIDKIKVYNKKSELEKITGVSSGHENYVLDLQTKREFDGTLMASAEIGYGNKDKKEAELQVNLFKKGGNNFSIIARSDNRHMTTTRKDSRQDFAGIGFVKNINKDLTLNGHFNYNLINQGNESSTYNEQYLTTGNKYQYSTDGNSNNHRMANSTLGMRWQIDPKTFLYVSGNMGITRAKMGYDSRQASFSSNPQFNISDPFSGMNQVADDIRINDISMHSLSSNDQQQYSVNANITRVIKKKGSSISLTASYSDGKDDNENFTVSTTTYYLLENALGNDSVLHRNQYQLTPTKTRNRNIGLLFSHPFTERLRLQLGYTLNYSKQRNTRNTYNLSGFMGETAQQPGYLPPNYEEGYTDSLSNHSHSRTMSHDLAIRMNYTSDAWDLGAGLSILPEQRTIHQKTGLLYADTTTHTTGFQPFIQITRKKEQGSIRLYYYGNTQQPQLSSLLSLTDNSNPLNISKGNPNLKPSYRQSVRLEVQDTRKGLFATLDWQNEINSQTFATIYNPKTGGRETYPVNINGNWDASAMLRYQKRIRQFNYSIEGIYTYNQNVSLLNEGQSEQPGRSKTSNTGTHVNLVLTYTPKWGGIDMRGRWFYQHSTNSLRQVSTHSHNYTFTLNSYAELPRSVQLKTDASYKFRNGTNIEKGEDDQFEWNAHITWRFLKKKQAELSASWMDILSQAKNYYRNTTTYGFYERHTQQIGSYFMVSMRYRFNRESKKREEAVK